jgi:hypothetical protein
MAPKGRLLGDYPLGAMAAMKLDTYALNAPEFPHYNKCKQVLGKPSPLLKRRRQWWSTQWKEGIQNVTWTSKKGYSPVKLKATWCPNILLQVCFPFPHPFFIFLVQFLFLSLALLPHLNPLPPWKSLSPLPPPHPFQRLKKSSLLELLLPLPPFLQLPL